MDSSEHFPNINLQYLDAVIDKAASLGMFVVMDLHGAPGAQKGHGRFYWTSMRLGEICLNVNISDEISVPSYLLLTWIFYNNTTMIEPSAG